MTRYTPLWEQQGQYAASLDRRLIGAFCPVAACNGVAVTPQGGNMSCVIAPGAVVVPTQNSTGSTLCVSDANEVVTLAVAPGTGTNRIDVITCQPRANDIDGGTNNDFIFNVITGTAAASPAVPTVPAGQVALSQVLVGANVTSIVAGNITDMRPAFINGLAEPATTSATTVSRKDIDNDTWVAKAGVNGGAWFRARDVLVSTAGRNAAWGVTTTSSPLGFEDIIRDAYGLRAPGNNTWTVPVPGFWRMKANFAATAVAAGNTLAAALRQNGTVVTNNQACAGGAQRYDAIIDFVLFCAVGDTLQAAISGSVAQTGINLGLGVYPTIAEVEYVGSG